MKCRRWSYSTRMHAHAHTRLNEPELHVCDSPFALTRSYSATGSCFSSAAWGEGGVGGAGGSCDGGRPWRGACVFHSKQLTKQKMWRKTDRPLRLKHTHTLHHSWDNTGP